MPRFVIGIEVDMPEGSSVGSVEMWAASLLDTAFRKPNPEPRPIHGLAAMRWTRDVPMAPSEHPYRPKVVGARRRR